MVKRRTDNTMVKRRRDNTMVKRKNKKANNHLQNTTEKTKIKPIEGTFVDTKRVIRSRKSKDGYYNGQNKMDNRTNNDLQNITQKTND